MQFNKEIIIGNKKIGKGYPAFVIAEAGVNHNGDMKLAKKMIDAAVHANADAVKFQAFRSDKLILKNVKKAPYQTKTTDSDEAQFEMLKRLELSKEQNLELKQYCEKKEIIFLTTPFDEFSLKELDDFNLPAYKIASTDTTNLPFLIEIAKRKKCIVFSTGMAYLSEIEIALKEIFPFNNDVILLQCTANYPIEDNEANLNVINTFKDRFDILVGYSDHSQGIGAAPYAVAMGALVVEKHFTLDKSFVGPDHKASLTPDELARLVGEIRKVEKYLGSGVKIPAMSEQNTRNSLQKCFVAVKPIKKGEKLSYDNVVAKRTGGVGISPIYYKNIIGSTADRDYEADGIICRS